MQQGVLFANIVPYRISGLGSVSGNLSPELFLHGLVLRQVLKDKR